ncbi:hypothetical protein [Pseudoflavonifractor intestinihominis]|uniref:Uncharacterized protein n=1 Tax=Pseudoflavonifractor intestinihominis TaxID=3133171 RepID=A0ABV1E6D4_9FIRM|nr:hypothetical protein [uncultured Pseudoflavonifractor sp.]
MRREYNDMYALFRHEPGAEEYFERLPSYLQDRIRPRYQMVNSFATLEACAERFCGPE